MNYEMLFGIYLITFFHMLGALVLLPIGDGAQAIIQKTVVALALACGCMNSNLSIQINADAFLSHFVGGAIGTLPLVIILHAASGVGELIEVGRGMTIGQIMAPHLEMPESSLSYLARSAVLALLGMTGVFSKIIITSIHFTQIENQQDLALKIATQTSDLLGTATPFLFLYLVIELFMGFISKILPGLSISQELFMAKSICGLLFLTMLVTQSIDVGILHTVENTGKLLLSHE